MKREVHPGVVAVALAVIIGLVGWFMWARLGGGPTERYVGLGPPQELLAKQPPARGVVGAGPGLRPPGPYGPQGMGQPGVPPPPPGGMGAGPMPPTMGR